VQTQEVWAKRLFHAHLPTVSTVSIWIRLQVDGDLSSSRAACCCSLRNTFRPERALQIACRSKHRELERERYAGVGSTEWSNTPVRGPQGIDRKGLQR